MAASFLLTLVDVFHEVTVLLGVSPNDLILLVNDNAHLLQTFELEFIKVSLLAWNIPVSTNGLSFISRKHKGKEVGSPSNISDRRYTDMDV